MGAKKKTIAVLQRLSEIHIADCEVKRRLTISASDLKEKYGRDIPKGTYRLGELLEMLIR